MVKHLLRDPMELFLNRPSFLQEILHLEEYPVPFPSFSIFHTRQIPRWVLINASDLLLLSLPIHLPRVGSSASLWTRNRVIDEGLRWIGPWISLFGIFSGACRWRGSNWRVAWWACTPPVTSGSHRPRNFLNSASQTRGSSPAVVSTSSSLPR